MASAPLPFPFSTELLKADKRVVTVCNMRHLDILGAWKGAPFRGDPSIWGNLVTNVIRLVTDPVLVCADTHLCWITGRTGNASCCDRKLRMTIVLIYPSFFKLSFFRLAILFQAILKKQRRPTEKASCCYGKCKKLDKNDNCVALPKI